MKIISDFKDYYDGVSVDPSGQLFHRKGNATELVDYPNDNKYHEFFDNRRRFLDIEDYFSFFIGFCGKIYLGYCVDEKMLYPLDFKQDKILLNEMLNRRKSDYFKVSYEAMLDKGKCLEAVFEQFNIPIFSCRKFDRPNDRKDNTYRIVIEKSPNLEYLGFPRIKDAHTCYQDIDMFIDNMQNTDASGPVGNDVTLANSKGYDKFSFRKEKGLSKRINRKDNCN